MKARLVCANIFNFIDVALTLLALRLNIGIEGNPIMQPLTENPALFIFIKITAVMLLTLWVGLRSKNGDKFGIIASWYMLIATLLIIIWNGAVISTTLAMIY